jgi:GT2 family glycosyltransferase
VNWNGAHLLPSCLTALRGQTVRDFEVWVVDNASADGSRELLARDFPEVRVIANPDNRGFAGGNNTALRQVRTPVAVLLNNDATPEPDWLEHLLAPFDEPGNEGLGAVTSKVVFQPVFAPISLATQAFSPPRDSRELGVRITSVAVDGVDVTAKVLWERLAYGQEAGFRWTRPTGELLVPLPSSGRHEVAVTWSAETTKPVELAGQVFSVTPEPGVATLTADGGVDVVNNVGSLVLTAGYGADRGYQEVDEGQYDEPVEVFAACGCAVAFRTEAGRAVDWFDDDFFLYYEDTDLSWRLRAAGWGIRFEPKAVVRHVHAASSVEWSPVFTFHTTRNRLLMLVKDASWPRVRHELVSFLVETLGMLLTAVRGLARGRRPARRPLQMRLRVLWSLARLMPRMLRRRRQVRRSAKVDTHELERWLVTSR